MIAASNIAPSFHYRKRISALDLPRIQDPAVIFEHEGVDSDGERFYVYTVAGWLDGANVFTPGVGGCTVGGDVITVNASSRAEADEIAIAGLQASIEAEASAGRQRQEALDACARLESVGSLERMRMAQASPADKSDAFVEDADKLRSLAGDDIVLTVGGQAQ
jgi:hypothetical protein